MDLYAAIANASWGHLLGLRGDTTDFLDGLKPVKSNNAEAAHVERFRRRAASRSSAASNAAVRVPRGRRRKVVRLRIMETGPAAAGGIGGRCEALHIRRIVHEQWASSQTTARCRGLRSWPRGSGSKTFEAMLDYANGNVRHLSSRSGSQGFGHRPRTGRGDCNSGASRTRRIGDQGGPQQTGTASGAMGFGNCRRKPR